MNARLTNIMTKKKCDLTDNIQIVGEDQLRMNFNGDKKNVIFKGHDDLDVSEYIIHDFDPIKDIDRFKREGLIKFIEKETDLISSGGFYDGEHGFNDPVILDDEIMARYDLNEGSNIWIGIFDNIINLEISPTINNNLVDYSLVEANRHNLANLDSLDIYAHNILSKIVSFAKDPSSFHQEPNVDSKFHFM